MYSFKKSLAALAGLSLLVVTLAALLPLVGQGQGGDKNLLRRDQRKSFYLTQTLHNGSQALTACAEGYHMASLWEIFDTSNLRYNTELGHTSPDSGFGPPTAVGSRGWIRTGSENSVAFEGGVGSCNSWTSADDEHGGTTVGLSEFWESTAVTVVSPWSANGLRCSIATRVWCVQD